MKHYFFFTFLLFWNLLKAQTALELSMPSHATCATPSPTAAQRAEISQMVEKLRAGKQQNAGATCIPMKAHIVLNAANVPAVSILDMNKSLTYLNNFFLEEGLEFFWCQIEYVTNDDYYTFNGQSPDNDTEAGLVALPGFVEVNTAINVYFVNSLTLSSGFNACGYAYYPCNSIQCTRILMVGGCTAGDPNGT